MKKFIRNILLFSCLLIAGFLLVFLQIDGYDDAYYLRFTSPKQSSLILGTSRAAQGVKPYVLNEVLNRSDFFNYSFTIEDSPYGPVYLRSIKKKVRKQSHNGLFILTVDPWSLSSRSGSPNDSLSFRENNSFLAKTHNVNHKPNLFYLLKSYPKSFHHILKKGDTSSLLHKDGWLEIVIDMDSSIVQNRTIGKAEDYKKNNLPYYRFSETRTDYLKKTIFFLQQHGQVFLVRLPTDSLMIAIDENLCPDFNHRMESLCKETKVPYLDLSIFSNQFIYTDGNHISRNSANEISHLLGQWIKSFQE